MSNRTLDEARRLLSEQAVIIPLSKDEYGYRSTKIDPSTASKEDTEKAIAAMTDRTTDQYHTSAVRITATDIRIKKGVLMPGLDAISGLMLTASSMLFTYGHFRSAAVFAAGGLTAGYGAARCFDQAEENEIELPAIQKKAEEIHKHKLSLLHHHLQELTRGQRSGSTPSNGGLQLVG